MYYSRILNEHFAETTQFDTITIMTTIFTKIINGEIPADIVYEDDIVLAFLDINPVNKGHTLVVPKHAFENIFDADIAALGHMMAVAQKIAHALVATVGATGVNLHMNNGADAGQEVPHAHLHIIPRFKKGEAFIAAKHDEYTAGESAVLAEKIKTAIV